MEQDESMILPLVIVGASCAVIAALLLAGYGVWKWDVCCPMPRDVPEGAIHICKHRKAFRYGGPRWWACPEWLRISQGTALKVMSSQLEYEAEEIIRVEASD